MMHRLSLCSLVALALTLGACTQPERAAAPVSDLQEAPMAAPAAPQCAPGEGDGIGGTGCAID